MHEAGADGHIGASFLDRFSPVWKKRVPGLGLALAVALAAWFAGRVFPVMGASVFGILFGIIVNNVAGRPASTTTGLDYSSKTLLKGAVVLLGSSMSLTQVFHTGADSLAVILATLVAAFLVAFFLGTILRTGFGLTSLIASGTAICGGSAIAAVAPCIDAEDKDVSYAISVVFLFNVVAVFLFPPLGSWLGLSQRGFGLFAGTAINDTSSVVAAGYVFGTEAGDYATVVKLTRTLMILPVSLAFAFIAAARRKRAAGLGAGPGSGAGLSYDWKKTFPWFVLGFIAMAALRTSGIVSTPAMAFLKEAGKFLIVLALSAIGLKTDFRKLVAAGPRPLFLGLAVWLAVALCSLGVQSLLGTV